MTGAIHSKVSSTNPTSATIVIVGTITTTLNIISATVNGAPLATAKAAPTSLLPNNPWDLENFPHPGPFADCVTENYSEKTATHPISCVNHSKYAPYVRLTKSAPTADTSTNWIRGHVPEDHKLTHTSAVGECVSFVRKKLNWPPINVTSRKRR